MNGYLSSHNPFGVGGIRARSLGEAEREASGWLFSMEEREDQRRGHEAQAHKFPGRARIYHRGRQLIGSYLGSCEHPHISTVTCHQSH